MHVVMADDRDVAHWARYSTCPPRHVLMTAPPGLEDSVEPCSVVGTQREDERLELHVLWQPDAEDLDRLNRGAGLWVTVVGSLPPHRVEVGDPP